MMTPIPLPANVSITISSGPNEGQEMMIDRDIIVIGRDKTCDFVVNDPYVSKQHCRIIFKQGYFIIEDCESLNKTIINKEDDSIHRLKNGDIISLGKTKLKFTWDAEELFEWL